MGEWLAKILDRVCAVLGALVFVQIPLFMQQYIMRLSGHVNELQYQVQRLEGTAKALGLSLQKYIGKFSQSKDAVFSSQGNFMEAMVRRLDNLSDSYTSLADANPLTRPFLFLYHSDWEIVGGTFSTYRIGFSLTIESIIYAIVGVIVGYYLYRFFSRFFSRVSQGFERARNKQAK